MYNAKVNSLNFVNSGHSHLIYEENTEDFQCQKI